MMKQEQQVTDDVTYWDDLFYCRHNKLDSLSFKKLKVTLLTSKKFKQNYSCGGALIVHQ